MESESTAISSAFSMVYILFSTMSVILLAIIFMLSFIDFIGLTNGRTRQYWNYLRKRPVLFKNTIDSKILHYASNHAKGEPYLIYTVQKVVNVLLIIVAIAFILLGCHICITIGLNTYVTMYVKEKVTQKIDLPYKILAALAIALVGGVSFSQFFKVQFLSPGIQDKVAFYKRDIDRVDGFLRDHIVISEPFLKALRDHDQATVVRLLASRAKQATLDDYQQVSKMIFTYNIYQHLTRDIRPINEQTYEEAIQNMVKISPYVFFYQPSFITNNYSAIPIEYQNRAIERLVIRQVSQWMQELNRMVSRIPRVSQATDAVQEYISSFCLLAFGFLAIMGSLASGKMIDMTKNIFQKVKWPWTLNSQK